MSADPCCCCDFNVTSMAAKIDKLHNLCTVIHSIRKCMHFPLCYRCSEFLSNVRFAFEWVGQHSKNTKRFVQRCPGSQVWQVQLNTFFSYITFPSFIFNHINIFMLDLSHITAGHRGWRTSLGTRPGHTCTFRCGTTASLGLARLGLTELG